MDDKSLIHEQLSRLNIKNDITELLISILDVDDDVDIYTEELTQDDIEILLDDLHDHSTHLLNYKVENKEEIIRILKYYLKISNPTQNCYLVINDIIDNLNGTLFNEGVEFDSSDFVNDYLILLYYINFKF